MIDKKELEKIAMSLEEYNLVVNRLKREPTHVELGMFSALWSEHCGYKHTRPLFHLFPTDSDHVLSKIGEENAGAIDIGDGYVAVFKAESHNHPSAVEPYEGAATGVGGILRDIFAMGMRPIALLDSLRFGDLKLPRTQYLLNGVVSGISGYGNCVGVPTVGGEIFFDNSFTGNPLVNVMCVGVGKKEDLTSAKATGKDNLLILVGADTGRDGIHGATFASVDLSEDSVNDRPAVQVGNPFMEKLLMEACIELAQNHQDWIIGIQDLGAAGLTSSSLEAAERGGSGLEIDIAKVPQREIAMSAYEIMLSESQERMLIIAKKEFEKEIIDHFKKWELSVSVIGKVNDTNKVIIKDNENILADAEINLMTDAPTYELKYNDNINQYPYYNPEISIIKDLEDPNASLLEMLALPNICSKKSVYQQYDHQVLNNTIVKPGFGAAVIRVPGTDKALAMTIDCNSRKVKMDPYCGSKIAVAEATRNLVAAGSKPLALTDCLNFGNPDKPEVAYQLANAVKGIAEAADILETPVISGNASLYNDTAAGSIAPTPVIGMVGLIDNIHNKIVRHIPNNQKLLLIGSMINQEFDTLSGSEYYFNQTNSLCGQLKIDLEFEKKIQAFILNIFNEKMAYIASDISDGGLLVAMAEICINYEVGFDGTDLPENLRLDATYFGEKESRFIVCIEENNLEKIINLAKKQEIPCEFLGSFINQKNNFFHFDQINLPLSSITEAYNQIF
jgi:phosphoribosylformylglycinamidine synthase subunit PurL